MRKDSIGMGAIMVGTLATMIILYCRHNLPDIYQHLHHAPQVGDLYTIAACHPGRGGVYTGCATIVGESNGLFLTHDYWLNEAGTSWGYFDYEPSNWFNYMTFQANWSNEVQEIDFK